MKTPVRYLSLTLLAAGIFFAGYTANRQNDPSTSAAAVEKAAKYICPMHPQYTSDRPSTCPVCGMSLVPDSNESETPSEHEAPGTVRVSLEKRQLAGVKVEEARIAAASAVIRIPGRVSVDASRLYPVVAASDGWIRTLGQNPVGTMVRKNEVLASYYAQNFQAAQQALFSAASVADRLQGGGSQNPSVPVSTSGTTTTNFNGVAPLRPAVPIALQNAIDGLRAMGMAEIQIQEMQNTRRYEDEIRIYSPADGYVVERNVSPGQFFEKGRVLYSIADVRRIWVVADVYEKDRDLIRPGGPATVSYRGQKLPARMSQTLPQFDSQSRTLKARFELDNSGAMLLPDMFVDVEVPVEKPAALTVPADAVIDSGRRKTVYVELGDGVFEPRLVKTGWRFGDRVQVIEGLETGERVVIAGNFLIDSESRMRMPDHAAAIAAEKPKTVKDPVCGMDVDPKSANTRRSVYKGETYYFCCDSCKKSFDADPDKYVQGKKTQGKESQQVKDLVCGMTVDPESPNTRKSVYEGKTYYFCCDSCKKSFDANPRKYVRVMAGQGMPGTHSME